MGRLWGRVFTLFLCLVPPSMARAREAFLHQALEIADISKSRPETESEPGKIFQEVYSDPKVYTKGACPDNICRLLRRFDKAGLDLTKGRVLFLYSKEKNDLYPQRAREGIAEWGFHTVLEYEGKVYDFDYRDDVQPTRTYLQSMFVFDPSDASELLKDIQVRAVPASEFHAEHDCEGNQANRASHQAYLDNKVPNRNYPSRSMADFLAALPPDPRTLRDALFRAMPRIGK